jgi:hypothetical protein
MSAIPPYWQITTGRSPRADHHGPITTRVAIRIEVEHTVFWDHRKLGGAY